MSSRRLVQRKGVKSKQTPPGATVLDAQGTPVGESSVKGFTTYEALRYAAARDYVCSEDGISLAQLNAMAPFSSLTKRTLEDWCSKDRWVERRKEWLETQSRKWEDAFGTKLIQNRLAEMALLEKMGAAMDAAALEPQPDGSVKFVLQPKSMESYVHSRLELGERLDSLRVSIGDHIVPQVVQQATPTSADARPTNLHPNLRLRPTEEEAYAMIEALLDVRQREQEKRMADHEAGKPSDPYLAQLEAPKKKRPPPPSDEDADEDEET